MQPMNYSAALGTPFDGALKGVQQALSISGAMDNSRVADAQVAAAQAQAQKAQAEQAEFAAQRADLIALSKDPSPARIIETMARRPKLSEDLVRVYNTLGTERKQERLSQAGQVYAAIQSGNTDVAKDLLKTQADAYRLKGMEAEANMSDFMLRQVEADPQRAASAAGMFLASATGAEKFAETYGRLGTERRADEAQPDVVRKGKADADAAVAAAASAAVKAKFAESDAALDLQKKGWDITKVQEDIKIAKLNSQIAAASVAASRDSNGLRREELALRIEDMKRTRDREVRERTAEVESTRASIDNLIDTADQVLNTPNNVKRNAMGPVDSRLPTIRQDVANFEELVGTLGSQVFLAQAPAMKGLGALTEAEGARLEKALKSFSLRQTPEMLDQNIKEVQRLTLKARRNLATKYGVPDTVPDTPSAASKGNAADIEALVLKYAPNN